MGAVQVIGLLFFGALVFAALRLGAYHNRRVRQREYERYGLLWGPKR
jgi:hypothetical protein